MTRYWRIAALLLALAASGPAPACRIYAGIDLTDVRFADTVVVGRIVDYRIVRDEAFRKRMLARPNLPADMRAMYESSSKTLIPDYARFEIVVDEVLAGRAARRVSATWSNSTFSLPPSVASGPLLIALRRPSSPTPPLRGPSATIIGNREPDKLTILQAPCASPFMFDSASDQARAVRRLLHR